MPSYIDQDEILRLTNGGKMVFERLIPGFKDHGSFKLRSDEETASCSYYEKDGISYITDFGNGGKAMTAVSYVMDKEALTYYNALLYIEQVFLNRTTVSGKVIYPKWRSEYSTRTLTTEDKVGQMNFYYKDFPSEKDLQSIGPFVEVRHLLHFNCKALISYEMISEKDGKKTCHIYKATEDFPMFLFDYGDFKKIYKPHEQKKAFRFMWYDPFGKKTQDMIFGLDQIRKARNEFAVNSSDDDTGAESADDRPPHKKDAIVRDLFRCSGESDALNLFSLGYHVYWLNSETIGYGNRFREVNSLTLNHYQIFDLDKTGLKYAHKTAEQNFELLNIPLPAWLSTKKDFRGNPAKDIKDYINTFKTSESAKYGFDRLAKGKARAVKFWWEDKENRIRFSPINFAFFLEVCGYARYKYSVDKNKDYCFIFIKDKIVRIMSPDNIKAEVKSFTLEWLESKNLTNEVKVLNAFISTKSLSDSVLETLPFVEIILKNYSKDTEYIHFKNKSLKITADKIETIKHIDVPNHILGNFSAGKLNMSHVVPRELGSCPKVAITVQQSAKYLELTNQLKSNNSNVANFQISKEIANLPVSEKVDIVVQEPFFFSSFLEDLSRIHWQKEMEKNESLTVDEVKEQNAVLANLMYTIGYMLAQHKSRTKAWAVFAQDMKISAIGESSGRSGKSLIMEAVKKIRLFKDIEGRTLDNPNVYQFLYEGLTEFHDGINVDDFSEHANFEYFYNQITGSRVINAKHTAQVDLSFEESGKMFFSTNFELPKQTGSTKGRILNCGVSDFYHEKAKKNNYLESRTPETKYGKLLFDDFTQDEWNKFYWFMAYCLQLYMRLPRIDPPMENIEKRQLRREMSNGMGRGEHFLNWANDYFEHLAPGKNFDDSDINATSLDIDDKAYFNQYFSQKIALEHFKIHGGLSDANMRKFSSHLFRLKLEAWTEYNDYILNPSEKMDASNSTRKNKKILGQTITCFYIQTKEPLNTLITNDSSSTLDDANDPLWLELEKKNNDTNEKQ